MSHIDIDLCGSYVQLSVVRKRMHVNHLSAFLVLLFAVFASAQTPRINSGATVYIEPMNGYETYLAAALARKQVPLIVIADRNKADYIVTSTVSQHAPSQPAVVVNNTTNVNSSGYPGAGGFPKAGSSAGSTSASISVVDAHSSQVVFAYSVGKSANTNQLQSTAEACAKHVKEFIAKQKN
jgi:hypothetical protein